MSGEDSRVLGDIIPHATTPKVLCVPKDPQLPWTPPSRGTPFAAGFDLYASEDGEIRPMGGWAPHAVHAVHTNVVLDIPHHLYGKIESRSGLASRHGVHACAGVIDPDYKGEIIVLLENRSSVPYAYKQGDRVAQIVFLPRIGVSVEGAREATGERCGGFGSTGA